MHSDYLFESFIKAEMRLPWTGFQN